MESKKKDELAIETINEQISQCRNDITSYNTQFMTPALLCALLAAVAAITSEKNSSIDSMKLFYILPSLFCFALYNLIKYTQEQMRLGSYRRILEHLLNEYLEKDILGWEAKIPQGMYYIFFGAVVQIFFYIPIAAFLLWGFFQLERNILWVFFSIFDCIQLAVVLIMAANTLNVRKRVFNTLGYEIDSFENLNNKLHISVTKADNGLFSIKCREIENLCSENEQRDKAIDEFVRSFLAYSTARYNKTRLSHQEKKELPFINRAIILGDVKRIKDNMVQIENEPDTE